MQRSGPVANRRSEGKGKDRRTCARPRMKQEGRREGRAIPAEIWEGRDGECPKSHTSRIKGGGGGERKRSIIRALDRRGGEERVLALRPVPPQYSHS